MQRKTTKLFLFLFALVTFGCVFMLWQGKSAQNGRANGMGMYLVEPAFAQQAEASFLEQEAGLAIYTGLSREIDMETAKAGFKTVERETDTYIIGSFSISEYEKYGKEDLHCFVHRDGWIVVYYLSGNPTAKTLNWQDLGNNKLEMGLAEMCSAIGVVPPYVRYYHFEYPDAAELMVIAKWQNRSFRVMIPSNFIVYERSWSSSQSSGSLEIDGTRISKSSRGGEYGTYGLVTPTQLKQDVFHTVSGNCAIVLVYRET